MFSRRHSLARTLDNLNLLISELEALDAQHAADHDALEAEIARIKTKRDNLIAERQQASVIATNLRSLTGAAQQ